MIDDHTSRKDTLMNELDGEPMDEYTSSRNSEQTRGRRSAVSWSFGVAVALAVVGLAVVLVAERSGGGGTSITAASPSGDHTSPSAIASYGDGEGEAEAVFDEQAKSGWVPYNGRAAVRGIELPESMWLKWDEDAFPPVAVNDVGRADVYDAPNGSIIGYTYSALGFVPREIADDPAFDITTLYNEMYGCDVRQDGRCGE